MIAVYLLGVLALASAAPHYGHYGHYSHHNPNHSSLEDSDFFRNYFREDDLLDTMKMWKELSDELTKLEDALNDYAKHFPSVGVTQEGIDGDNYKIRIPLAGFNEQDIVVKAREGLLMVQATHKQGSSSIINSSYLNIRNLPSNIDVVGTWIYENEILTITFPLKEKPKTTTEAVITSTKSDQSREELEPIDKADKSNADVGLERGDTDVTTKKVPRNEEVEATTYAVDISNEIEFVPMQIKALPTSGY